MESCDRCRQASVTVLIPCHNEEVTIAGVVREFAEHLPTAQIVVADNLSTDATSEVARMQGAVVISVPYKGKGRAVRRLLEHSYADVTIMVDGDLTYDASVAPRLVHEIVCSGFDLVNVSREVLGDASEHYRVGHRLGNWFLTSLQQMLTGIRMTDILTGYKAMSRRFVTSFPVKSQRFQLEVEIASHAVALDFAYEEFPAPYRPRPTGSVSKLNTYQDGFSLLRAILRLYRDLRPFSAFLALSIPWFVLSAILVYRPIADYASTGQVSRFPSLIAGVAVFLVGMLLMTSGWILERTRWLRRDLLVAGSMQSERIYNSEIPEIGRL